MKFVSRENLGICRENPVWLVKWHKVSKSGLRKFCRRQPLKNLKGYGLLVPNGSLASLSISLKDWKIVLTKALAVPHAANHTKFGSWANALEKIFGSNHYILMCWLLFSIINLGASTYFNPIIRNAKIISEKYL